MQKILSEKMKKVRSVGIVVTVVCFALLVIISAITMPEKEEEALVEKFYTQAEYDRIFESYPQNVLTEYNRQYSVITAKPLTVTKEKVDEYTYYDDIGLKISGEFYIKPLLGTRYYYTYECTFLWDKELKIFYYMGTTIADKEKD